MTEKKQFVHRSGDIEWYCEQSGSGDDVILIPSGEGDCSAFDETAEDLARSFRVTTFDTPGYSRSSAPANPEDISTATLGDQIAALIRSLGIQSATVYGCSSGGLATLDLVARHKDIIHRAIVHEVAFAASESEEIPPFLAAVTDMDDDGIAATLSDVFANILNENKERWDALGDAYHERLKRNYVTWVKRYILGKPHLPVDPATLAGLPITWTIGGLSMVAPLMSNIQTAHRAGIDIGMLPCRHFPQVSIAGILAAHVRQAVLGAK